MTSEIELSSSLNGEHGDAAPLCRLLREAGEEAPGSCSDLFEKLRTAAPDGNAGFKQFITNLADRVPIDWEGLLHGRTWEDLAISEIEDGIVLGIFHKAHGPLTEEGRAKFAEQWIEGGGSRATLDAISSGDAKILRKLDARQIQLLRRLTWELSETGAIDSTTEIADSGKSLIYSNVEISGSIKFRGELVFEGRLKTGEIAGDTLALEKNARVNGDVTVEFLKLSGKVAGNVTALRKCELGASAELIGDLTAQRLSMEEGATLIGQVRLGMNPDSPNSGR